MFNLESGMAELPVFRQLHGNQQAKLLDRAFTKQLSGGEFAALQGDRWPYVCVVRDGALYLTKQSSGERSLTVGSLGPGETMWSRSLFSDLTLPVSLGAKSASTLYLWRQADIIPVMRENPEALWELCQHLVGLTTVASEVIEGLAFQTVAARLAKLLLQKFPEAHSREVSRDLTLEEMAAMIGSKPEIVCRLLHRFADDGLLQVTRTTLSSLDREGLAELAALQ